MKRIAGLVSFGRTPVESFLLDRAVQAMKLYTNEQTCLLFQGEAAFASTSSKLNLGDKNTCSHYARSDRQHIIVFDGRIDNRQELLGNLHSQLSAREQPVTDEEILTAAYDNWGLDFPKHLTGDFALALWDNVKHCLICVRDQFGVKPFYFAHHKDYFLFASNPIAILASGKIPAYIYEERIADYLVNPLEGIDKNSTFYQAIFRLPPAHIMVIQSEKIILQRYWELSPVELGYSWTNQEYIEVFHGIFENAVRCRLQDPFGAASMLSGGLDSSLRLWE